MAFKSRWATEQKITVVEFLNPNISMAEFCRKHSVTPNAFYDWKEKSFQAGKLGLAGSLKSNPSTGLAEENERLKTLIGELTIAKDALRKALMEGGKRR